MNTKQRGVASGEESPFENSKMVEAALNLWQQRETARKELVLFYLPLVDLLAKRIARSTGTNWEDLRQDGYFGLMKAITKFDPSRGVPFTGFAKPYIRGAIFDSPELTRQIARQQDEIYRKMRRTEEELTRSLQRNPTIEEVAEKAGLTTGQIRSAIDAHGVAFAGAFPDSEVVTSPQLVEYPQPETKISVGEALSSLPAREQEVIRLYYWEGQSHEEIGREMKLTAGNVAKILQRSRKTLREQLDVSGERRA